MGGGAAPRYAPEDPTLPKPWRGLVDDTTGYLYYWNPETNVTQYERPQEELPPPPPFLPPPPPRLPSKSASVIGSSSSSAAAAAAAAGDQHRRHHHQHRRDSNEDDIRYARSRSNQAEGSRGGDVDNLGQAAKGSRDLRTTSARGHGPSSVVGAVSSVEAYRHQHEIFVTGDDVPAPFTTFESTGFPSEILKEGVLTLCGVHDAQAKPVLLCSTNDNTVRLYDLPSFNERGKIFSKEEVRAIQIGPGGLFFTGDGTGELKVWKWLTDETPTL